MTNPMPLKTVYPFELEASWQAQLSDELNKPYMRQLSLFLESEYAEGKTVYPPKNLIFNAFNETPFPKVKVLILGQDPYHGEGQAHGLAFSVPTGIKPPPSLKNIFKELESDMHLPQPNHGNLTSWAKQGVMLLNTTLTVRESEPLSHAGKGWETFTDAVITSLIHRNQPIIFVLWGRSAQTKVKHLEDQQHDCKHLVLQAAHPSPFSAHQGFFGCRHFSQINNQLKEWKLDPINWNL